MILRLIQIGNSLPLSYPVSIFSQFEPGMIGQLTLMGNNIVCGVSDGTAPLGIIDDVQTVAFSAPSIDETHLAPVVGQQVGPNIVSVVDVTVLLNNPNINTNSFICDTPVFLRERNGAITIPAGTVLNYNMSGGALPDSIKIVCSYAYQVPGIPGDCSTAGSNRITIHNQRGVYQTDKYEVNMAYPLNANLFVSENGLLTTRQSRPEIPAVGFVTGPATSRNIFLEFMWL